LQVRGLAHGCCGRFCRMMDFVLQAWVSGLIESEKLGWMLGKGKPWQPGEKLKLLFAGYNGTRNTGWDVRVEEMLRQIRHLLVAEGIAAAQNKLSVGYGSEAGHMDPMIAKMCARYCKNSLVITRNVESRKILRDLGVPTELGTDTAWTFEPLPVDYGRKVLAGAGWNGHTPVMVVCPINPFWWPVKPSVAKYVARRTTGAYADSHYRTIYFQKSGPEVDFAFDRYITAVANGVAAFRQQRNVFVVMVATERLDAHACHLISER